jgi:branched-chain amino acid transport system ATP-binding protein
MPPEGTARLRLTGFTGGYFGQPVVRDLDLEVPAGGVVALLGANGAGKTTTLATIAGLNTPLGGSIEVDGEEIGGRPTHLLAREGISLVPENRALFNSLTVQEHIKLAGSGDAALPIDALVEMLPELEKCMDRKAGVLSGGEQQMLAVGRALVGRPKLLLVDEMSLGLAPIIVERLLPILRRVATEMGTGVLFVEQHVPLALRVADHAYVLSHGRLVAEGAATEMSKQQELLRSSYLGDEAADEIAVPPSRSGAAREVK